MGFFLLHFHVSEGKQRNFQLVLMFQMWKSQDSVHSCCMYIDDDDDTWVAENSDNAIRTAGLLITIWELTRKKLIESVQLHFFFSKMPEKAQKFTNFRLWLCCVHKDRLNFLFAFIHLSNVNIHSTSDQKIWNISLAIELCEQFVHVPTYVWGWTITC